MEGGVMSHSCDLRSSACEDGVAVGGFCDGVGRAPSSQVLHVLEGGLKTEAVWS